MPGVIFQTAPLIAATANRADVACFVGFVGRRAGKAGALPDTTKQWLRDQGWCEPGTPISDDDELLNKPVPIESFEDFERLFAWERRPAIEGGFAHPTWLGAAVRAFFSQGGARCLVVRVGDPLAYELPATQQLGEKDVDFVARRQRQRIRLADQLELLLPGVRTRVQPSPNNRTGWRGFAALLGLEEAAFACLPDLPELVADAALERAGLSEPAPAPEVFVECGPDISPPEDSVRQISSTPACTAAGFAKWFAAVNFAAQLVCQHRRDVQLLLAVPLAARQKDQPLDTTRALNPSSAGLAASLDELQGIATAFLQLAHPWLLTSWSEAMPGGIEPPDGTVAGVLARSIAVSGAHRSIGNEPVRGVLSFVPELSSQETQLNTGSGESLALIDRVTLVGPSPTGVRMLSDVTTSLSPSHRSASVGRLTAAILRAARQLGGTLVFEPSGPELWRKIEGRLDSLLADFYAAGALLGATRRDAWSVRCDETTTTPNDLDNGRVLVEVRFAPAHPIGLITVVLALRDGSVNVTAGAV